MRTLLVLGILVPGVAAALFNRFAALLLYLWVALFRPQEYVWIDLSRLRLSMVVGTLLVLSSLLTGVWPNLSHPLSVGGIAFLAAAGIAQLNAVDQATGLLWLEFLARLLLVCLLCVTLTNSRARFVMVITVIGASFGFHSAKAGVSSILQGGARFTEGLAGAFVDNNGYALGMVMTLWLLVAAAQNAKSVWLRRGLLVAAPLTAVATISTYSRGGFLALAVSTVAFVLLQRRRMLPMVALAALAAASPFMPLPDGYRERIETIRTYEEIGETSALSRLHYWRVAVDMAIDNPLGVGLFNYQVAYDRYDSTDGQYLRERSVHSSYFQVLAETGFIGAAIYGSMLVYSLVIVLKVRRRALTAGLDAESRRFLETSANALGAAMVGFLTGGAFIALALNDLTWFLFALLASLDRLSVRMCADVPAPAELPSPLAVSHRVPRRFAVSPPLRPAASR